ncbi:MAG TPA: tetratricopeptide repeat protein [Bryobacteraceae bacterium]|nr:tetratricopeptide repeat protein [Bryobacteraceae bacterium]
MKQRTRLRMRIGLAAITGLSLGACHHGLSRSARITTPSNPKSAVSAAMDRQIVNALDAGDGDYPLRTLRAKLDANPSDLTLRLQLAEQYRSLGFPEIAIEHGRLAVERAPDSEEARLGLAKMLRSAERSAEAEKGLLAFSQSHDPSARLWAWIGLLRDDESDWKGGEIAHRKALALAPGRDDLHNNLGYCLLRQGRREEAAAEFAAALRLNPNSTIARNNLGTALTGSGKEAVANLQSVTDPATAHSNLAAALIEAGQYDEARREIATALGYNRQHSAALKNLELIAQLDGKPAELQRSTRAEGKWAHRAVSAWHKFWGVTAPADSQESRKGDGTGHEVASR